MKLGGFDLRAEAPSSLLPRLRLARVYWPRRVLCLHAHVPAESLYDIRTRELDEAETRDALDYVRDEIDTAEPDGRRYAISEWKSRKEYAIWQDALRVAGFDPDTMDWHDLEDPASGEARYGAQWRTYWDTLNLDLHLVAEGHPEALRFGLSFGGGSSAHWTVAPKSLYLPSDDEKNHTGEYYPVYHASWGDFRWFYDQGKAYVSRGLRHEYDLPANEEGEIDTKTLRFGDEHPPIFGDLMTKPLWPLQSNEAWEMLTMRMHGWNDPLYSIGSTKKDDGGLPRLRPLFDAPSGWSPAPDGSLASAILRSLAYGDGGDRLDDKFIAGVNNLVRCFSDMKNGLSQGFDAALHQRGYIADS